MECRCGCHKPKGFTAEGTISCARLVRWPWKVGTLPFNGKNTVIWRGTAKPDPSVNIYEGWVCKAQCANQVPSSNKKILRQHLPTRPFTLAALHLGPAHSMLCFRRSMWFNVTCRKPWETGDDYLRCWWECRKTLIPSPRRCWILFCFCVLILLLLCYVHNYL